MARRINTLAILKRIEGRIAGEIHRARQDHHLAQYPRKDFDADADVEDKSEK